LFLTVGFCQGSEIGELYLSVGFLSATVVLLFFASWLGARTLGALPAPLLEMTEVIGVTVLIVSQRWLEGSSRLLAEISAPERSER
jgi:hypothetical protein